MANTTKRVRLQARVRTVDVAVIRHAAAQAGESVSEFVTSAALERAHRALADQHDLVVTWARWDDFTRLLDEPEQPAPRLMELFARPRRITR